VPIREARATIELTAKVTGDLVHRTESKSTHLNLWGQVSEETMRAWIAADPRLLEGGSGEYVDGTVLAVVDAESSAGPTALD